MLKIFLFIFSLLAVHAGAQTLKPDLHDAGKWQPVNREAKSSSDGVMELNAKTGDGMYILKDTRFSEGVINLRLKGENKQGQSFVGVAFHIQDEKTYEAVYFRPFNFRNKERENHSVQYISMPDYPWEKLRNEYPGKYENKIDPTPEPEGWMDVKIEISGKSIKVYVNNAPTPSLAVESLGKHQDGRLAVWVGNNSTGTFKDLKITPGNKSSAALTKPVKATTGSQSLNAFVISKVIAGDSDKQLSAEIPYGNNPAAGKYFNVGDAKLYYEVYGRGKPVLLLHGGVFGYIDEFSRFITELSANYQVICLATRGHGKSEAGKGPFSYEQRAEDAYKVARSVTKDSVIVLGFSDGGYSAFKLAAMYPDLVKKLIVIGAGYIDKGGRTNKFNYNADTLLKQNGNFFKGRMALMPQPDRWQEILTGLSDLYNKAYMNEETLGRIKCPTLVMAGDRDDYVPASDVLKAKDLIPGSQLSIIPGCSHVVFFCNYAAVRESIKPFL